MGHVLVIENSPKWHLGRMGSWLRDAQLEATVVRPHQGDELPDTADDYDAVIALGGGRGVDWARDSTALLMRATASGTATLAFCSSSRDLAATNGGTVSKLDEFTPTTRLIGRRDSAAEDPLFCIAPMGLDVVQWRHEELTHLPPQAELVAASPYGAPEVFRLGERTWGIQSHIELDEEMVLALGGSQQLAGRVDSMAEHFEDTWRPIIARFANLATGRTSGQSLPILES